MSDVLKTTVKLQRPARIRPDERGRSVWTEAVETAEFELMSTTTLREILASDDKVAKKSIRSAAESGDEGVLARDTATGHFEIISDADLQAILDRDFSLPSPRRPSDVTYRPAKNRQADQNELSLVSTQTLRNILGKEKKPKFPARDKKDTGFDPYNSG